MIILNNKIELNNLKEKNLSSKEIIDWIEKDMTFIFSDLPNLKYNNHLITYVLIDPKENIKSLVVNNVDLLSQTKPINLSFNKNENLIKATTKIIHNCYVSVYFYKYTSIELMNWIK